MLASVAPLPLASAPEQPRSRWAGLAASAAPPLLLTALVLVAYAPFLGQTFTGGDSWPHLWTSRVTSFADFWALLTHPVLFKTSFPSTVGLFYRPVSLLSYTLDEALFGLDAPGYHATDLLIHLADVLLLYALLRASGLRRWTATLGAAFLCLHPVAVTVVPNLPRRHDSLAALGVLGALLSLQPLVSTHLTGRAVLGYAVLAAGLLGAAELAKESAFAGVPLLLLWLAMLGLRHRHVPRTWRRLAVGAATILAASLLIFGVRWLVLHGVGGYYQGTPLAPDNLQGRVADYLQRLLWPFADRVGRDPRGLLGTVLLLIVLPGLAVTGARTRPGARSSVVFGCLWLAVLGLFQMVTDSLAPYQMYLAVVGLGLLAAGTADGLATSLAGWRRRALPRVFPLLLAPSALALLVLCAGIFRASPLFTSYPQWAEASATETMYLAAIQPCLDRIPDGATLRFDGFPRWMNNNSPQDQWVLAGILGEYSVGPAVYLLDPDRHFQVADSTAATDFTATPASVQVTCAPDAAGFWRIAATYTTAPASAP